MTIVLDRQDEGLDILQLETGKARRHAFEEVLDLALDLGAQRLELAPPLRDVLRHQRNAQVVLAEVDGVDIEVAPRELVVEGKTAQRVRTETGLGSGAVSVSYAAVELAKKIFGNLNGKCVPSLSVTA